MVKIPLKLAEWALRRAASEEDRFSICSDLNDMYKYYAREKGVFYAYSWYMMQVFISIPSMLKYSLTRSLNMFKNYFRVTFRNFKKYKGYSFINISGLAIGMACCIFIFLWVKDELSYDKYHKKADRIYRLEYDETIGGVHYQYSTCPFAAPIAFNAEVPEVKAFTRLLPASGLFKYKNQTFEVRRILFVDSTFFEIFSHEFIAGNSKNSLDSPGSIVMTEESAKRIFGKEEPLSRTINYNGRFDLKVTGVIKNVPKNSHFTFDYVISYNTLPEASRKRLNGWMIINGWVYVLLDKNAQPDNVQAKLPAIVDNHEGKVLKQYGTESFYKFRKLTDIHLRSHTGDEIEPNGDINYVYIFSAIAVFILVIACINFMNLSTARSANRRKEISMRKVFGAYRIRLIYQILGETFITAFIGITASILIVTALMPYFNELTGKEIYINHLNNAGFWFGVIIITIFTSIFAGSYPSFYLSSFMPAAILKGSLSGHRKPVFRNVLVVFQYAISIILIAGTIIIIKQLKFMKTQKLGFNKEQVLVVRLKGRNIKQKSGIFKKELLNNPDIVECSRSSDVPGAIGIVLTTFQEGKSENESLTMDYIFCDHEFVNTYGIEIIKGRDFSKKFATDTSNIYLINETAAEKFGWGEKSVGKKIGSDENDLGYIVGIVKDFHYKSLKEEIGPLVLMLNKEEFYFLSIKMRTKNISETISFIKNKWGGLEHDRNFEYFFVDERFNSLYQNEKRISRIITYFAILAIFVASLGLFGLASHTAERRKKEISIRKAVGAQVSKIVIMISGDFIKLVFLALILAVPVTYYLMSKWLEDFSYRINIGADVFICSAMLSIIIAILTVSYQAVKASMSNPVDSLREE